MRRNRAPLFSALVLVPILGLACGEPTREPRHLVVVTIDTLRQDRVGAYGHARAETPHLDALAARGIRFDDAIAQATITPPSHATLFTGLNPDTHGLTFLVGQALDARHRTLAEVLLDAGFETAAFVSAVPLRRAIGLDQGFDVYDDELGGAKTRSAGQTNERVARWLARDHAGRVFLWVHYFEPHHPYAAPEPYRSRFAPASERGIPALNGNAHSGRNRALPDADVEAGSRQYDAEVATVDAAVGDLLAMLHEAGVLDDAIVAVASDHGESLGERGYYFGHWDVFDETARIPLVVALPDGRWAGTAVQATVGSLDLMPTLLGWLGIPAPEAVEGVDLAALLDGAAPSPGRVLYTERGMSGKRVVRSVRDERWLLIEHANWRRPRTRLYDRKTGEPAPPAALADRERLAEALARHRGETARATPEPVSDEVAEQLRALGYGVPEADER